MSSEELEGLSGESRLSKIKDCTVRLTKDKDNTVIKILSRWPSNDCTKLYKKVKKLLFLDRVTICEK